MKISNVELAKLLNEKLNKRNYNPEYESLTEKLNQEGYNLDELLRAFDECRDPEEEEEEITEKEINELLDIFCLAFECEEEAKNGLI